MKWTVSIPKRVGKHILALPNAVQEALFLLVTDIQDYGPVQGA